jgi:activator of HSP90 ATPase
MRESIELQEIFHTSPAELYESWLDSVKHADMTGGPAECSNRIGGSFTAWDGYIEGTNIALSPNEEIVQSWRTSEFSDKDEDSELTLQFEETENGTLLTLIHTNIPEGQKQYEKGWIEHYFEPMKKYFSSL